MIEDTTVVRHRIWDHIGTIDAHPVGAMNCKIAFVGIG
jgi:hypothetical protein